jgi:ubiquinone/menaquinone biosynthesis C-methylase UbiE
MRHHLYRMHEAVLRSAPIRPGDRILYVGCNSAAFSPGMADQLARSGELVAIDFSYATLQRAERILEQSELKNMMFMRLSEPAIPFPDHYFDLVIAFGSYERFPMLDRVLDESWRVLKPEGKVYWHDVSTGLEGLRDRLVQALFLGRRPTRSQQALSAVRTKMSAYFTIEFHRRWTHTWGKQSCLLVGKKSSSQG